MAETGQAGGGGVLRGESVKLDVLVGLNVLDLLGGVDLVDHIIVGVKSHGTPCAELERPDAGGQDTAGLCVALAQVALGYQRGDLGLMGTDFFVVERIVVNDNVTPGDNVADIKVGDRDGGSIVLMGMSSSSWGSGDSEGGEEEGSGDRKANHDDGFLKCLVETDE